MRREARLVVSVSHTASGGLGTVTTVPENENSRYTDCLGKVREEKWCHL